MRQALTSPRFVVALLAILFALNFFGVLFDWYASVGWLDNVHHFLGGFWIGVLGFYLARARPRLFALPGSFLGTFVALLAFTALAGVAWEIYEFVFYRILSSSGSFPPPQFGHADTISDLGFDLFGAAVAAVLARDPEPRV